MGVAGVRLLLIRRRINLGQALMAICLSAVIELLCWRRHGPD